VELTIEVPFCAALRLPNLEGPCQRLHGHDYRLAVTVRGKPDAHTGAIVDFLALRRTVEEQVVSKLDHRLMNEVIENPTAEHMVLWIWQKLKDSVPSLSSVQLWESPEYSVTYRGE
jgi:6-pyruvoyltetrahydropterin/6-carboxytetrahydropterin synthase